MATRTPRAAESASEQQETPEHAYCKQTHERIEALSQEMADYWHTLEPLVLSLLTAPGDNQERPKVQRRRSLDDMQFALKRLASGEPRPADDESPQVLQDAINEVIALRHLVNDMMQASNGVYQHGLVAIRNMTAQ